MLVIVNLKKNKKNFMVYSSKGVIVIHVLGWVHLPVAKLGANVLASCMYNTNVHDLKTFTVWKGLYQWS